MTVSADRRLLPVVRLAPAKVNLTLAVVGRRPDGSHALRVQALSCEAQVGRGTRLAGFLHIEQRSARVENLP